jgi:hypothetical protein
LGVRDATKRLIAAFTAVLHTRKRAEVKYDKSASWPSRGGIEIVQKPQTLINQSSTNLDVVAPIKARACDALHAVLRSRSREGADSRLMTRGAERC